jgi:hypothetical protein
MLRTAICGVCILVALAAVVVEIASRITPLFWEGYLCKSMWAEIDVVDGCTRVCLLDGEESFIKFLTRGPDLRLIGGPPDRSWKVRTEAPWCLRLEIGRKEGLRSGHIRMSKLYFRLWVVILIFAAYPGVVLVSNRWRRWRRRGQGRCIQCGYDLRGTPSGRCSECGATRCST